MNRLDQCCPTCGGRGIIADAPDGERCYCECEKGVVIELGNLHVQIDLYGRWLHENSKDPRWDKRISEVVRECFDEATARYDELFIRVNKGAEVEDESRGL